MQSTEKQQTGHAKPVTTHATIDIQAARRALATSPIGHAIYYLPRTDSTMVVAHHYAQRDEIAAGAVVITEEQTSGRGRLQRTWSVPYAQGVLMSVILKNTLLPASPYTLPMTTGVAVVRALRITAPELADRVWLKWPNDVIIISSHTVPDIPPTPPSSTSQLGAGKVAGILIESQFRADTLHHAILGIGINANQQTADLPTVPPQSTPPTSIALASGRTIDRAQLLITLCKQLAIGLTARDDPPTAHNHWKSLLSTLGNDITLYPQNAQPDPKPITGRAVDVTLEGQLVVEDPTGICHTFEAGDVSLTKPPGDISQQ